MQIFLGNNNEVNNQDRTTIKNLFNNFLFGLGMHQWKNKLTVNRLQFLKLFKNLKLFKKATPAWASNFLLYCISIVLFQLSLFVCRFGNLQLPVSLIFTFSLIQFYDLLFFFNLMFNYLFLAITCNYLLVTCNYLIEAISKRSRYFSFFLNPRKIKTFARAQLNFLCCVDCLKQATALQQSTFRQHIPQFITATCRHQREALLTSMYVLSLRRNQTSQTLTSASFSKVEGSKAITSRSINFGQFMCSIAEILHHRHFSFKLSPPITGPSLLQYLCPSGYKLNCPAPLPPAYLQVKLKIGLNTCIILLTKIILGYTVTYSN